MRIQLVEGSHFAVPAPHGLRRSASWQKGSIPRRLRTRTRSLMTGKTIWIALLTLLVAYAMAGVDPQG